MAAREHPTGVHLWRLELAAIFLGFTLLLLCVAWLFLRTSGPTTIERGKIVRFGVVADEKGNHPTVLVATMNGQLAELQTEQAVILGCSIGDEIRLIRRPHSLMADPRGCR